MQVRNAETDGNGKGKWKVAQNTKIRKNVHQKVDEERLRSLGRCREERL